MDWLTLTRQLSPLLCLLLVHDFLLSKNGIAAPGSHPLRQTIERHKSRLKGEFIKARVRRGCASVEELKSAVLREKKTSGPDAPASAVYPRWVRVNAVRTTLDAQLKGTFSGYKVVQTLSDLGGDGDNDKRLFIDPHIPDLLAVPSGIEFSASQAYKRGEIILQDKASCFPAYLLAGEWGVKGDLVDGCAAPGNKTTHLAALLSTQNHSRKSNNGIISMDSSPARSKTLTKMVSAAGADDLVAVLQGQDFLAIDPATDSRFSRVTGLLLDPSCSGSGIVGRDDIPRLLVPESPQQTVRPGKKRKRGTPTPTPTPTSTTTGDSDSTEKDAERLVKLSNLQAHIVEHALSFPSATRVTYSTCSIHEIENEAVVARVLRSDVARRRGWRVLRREEQPVGLKGWAARGQVSGGETLLTDEEMQGCLRCWPSDEEGVGGFFVVGFVRAKSASGDVEDKADEADEADEEWEGFSD